jgi:hypothetical protein
MGVLVALGLSALVYGIMEWRQNALCAARARQEARAQEMEIQECRRRLTLFYNVWRSYRAAHRGAEPPSLESLIPKYIPDGKLLLCPTAERWERRGVRLSQGGIEMNRRLYPVSYGFRWLTAGNAKAVEKRGEEALLLTCEAHEEGIYRGAYGKNPPLGAFSAEGRRKLLPEVRAARMLIVRRNGKIDVLDPTDEQ